MSRDGIGALGAPEDARREVRRPGLRGRRGVALAAAVVLLTPVGWSTRSSWGWWQAATSPSSGAAGAPARGGTDDPAVVPDARTSASAPTPGATARAGGAGGLRLIPDVLALTDADFGQSLIRFGEHNEKVPPVTYGACQDVEFTRDQVVGGSREWGDDLVNQSLDIEIVITRWRPGKARGVFTLWGPGGRCSVPAVAAAPVADVPGDEVWAEIRTRKMLAFPPGSPNGPEGGTKLPTALVGSRVGDVILSIRVQDAAGTAQALRRAERLLSIAVDRAQAAGLTKVA